MLFFCLSLVTAPNPNGGYMGIYSWFKRYSGWGIEIIVSCALCTPCKEIVLARS